MELLTFKEYTELGGLVETEATFNRLYRKSFKLIKEVTSERINDETEFTQDIKYCLVELINAFGIEDNSSNNSYKQGGEVTSMSNDGYSVHLNPTSKKELKKQKINIITSYLYEYCNRLVCHDKR